MPIIKILNRDYNIACGPGEEARLFELASKLDKRLHQNANAFKGANDVMVIVLTALMMEDALEEKNNKNLDSKVDTKPDLTNNSNISNKSIDEITDRINALNKVLS